MRLKYFVLGCTLLALTACRKEAALQSTATNLLYTLPQGNHSYDQDIETFYNTYHSVVLYKFDSMDYQYNITGPLNIYLTVNLADTNAIATALDFLHANWLDLYPPDFLQKTLPFKLLLSSQISIGTPYFSQIVGYTYYSAYAGMNWVAFGLVNDSLRSLTAGQIDSTRGVLNRAYWQQAVQNQMVESPDGFDGLTNYATLTASNLRPNGCFYNHPSANSATSDLLDYVQVISSTDSVTFTNRWLISSVDTKGMYATKYKLVKSYYLTKYGVDLQAIGNK